MFDTSTAGGGRTMNFFTDNASSTHISPLFEQSIKADVPIFSKLPVFRDIWQLQEARLQLGYTYTWIGEVASPNQSIVWVSNPIDGVFPFIKASVWAKKLAISLL